MIRSLLPFAWVIPALLLFSCDDSKEKGAEDTPPEPQLTVTSSLDFSEKGGWKVLAVTTNGDWEATCKADWITLSPENGYLDGEVTVTVLPAPDPWGRETQVDFTSGDLSASARIVQRGSDYAMQRIDGKGAANCFLVPAEKGFYTFSPANPEESVSGVTAAKIVWQDHPGLVERISYDAATQSIGFVTGGMAGNAVVAAIGADDAILWSWHLWITDYDPETNPFTTPANDNGVSWRFMDRNLGARNATPGDIGALGLIYQWGRKDPFPGVGSFSGEEPPIYDGNGAPLPAPAQTADGFGTQELAAAHPSVFYKISYKTNDWTDPSDDDYWGGVTRRKTRYDPCPAGWRVPICDEEGLSPYGFMTRDNTLWSEELAGRMYETWWLPCAGTRVYESGELSFIANGPYGGMWIGTAGKASADPEFPARYGQYLFVIDGRMFKTSKDSRSQGMVMRCAAE